jgi:hypothetical protein
LNVTTPPPDQRVVHAANADPEVEPWTDKIAASVTTKSEGTWIVTQVISSPPPLSPRSVASSVMSVETSTMRVAGERSRAQIRAPSTIGLRASATAQALMRPMSA